MMKGAVKMLKAVFFSFGLILSSTGINAVHAAEADSLFPIAEVISQIKRELAAAQSAPGANVGLKLEKIELTFSIQHVRDASGKIVVGIPAAGAELGGSGGKKVDSTSTLQIELVPPRSAVTMSGSDDQNFGITQAIIETRRQLRKGLDEEPRLDSKKVQITLKFSATRTVGANGQIKFLVISAGGGASSVSTDTNSIALTFVKAGGL